MSLPSIMPRDIPSLDGRKLEDGTSLWQDAWRRLRKNRLALASLFFFLFMVLFSFVGPYFSPFGYEDQNTSLSSAAPFTWATVYPLKVTENGTSQKSTNYSIDELVRNRFQNMATTDVEAMRSALASTGRVFLNSSDKGLTYTVTTAPEVTASRVTEVTQRRLLYVMGSDTLGRDQLTRIMYGSRISLGVGFLATFVSLLIGVLYGAISGYLGGKTDQILMRLVDILYAMPFTIFVILLMVVFGRKIILIFIAIGAVEWLTMARIVRSQVLTLKKQEFIEAAISLGYSNRRIILRHIIPNVLGSVIIYTTLTIPAVMLLEAVLSFLGLGVPPPMSSLGTLINEGKDAMTVYPWLLIFPAFFFSATLFALNFLGDGLRDALDPKASKD